MSCCFAVQPWQRAVLPWDLLSWFPSVGPVEVLREVRTKQQEDVELEGLTACFRRSAASAAAIR